MLHPTQRELTDARLQGKFESCWIVEGSLWAVSGWNEVSYRTVPSCFDTTSSTCLANIWWAICIWLWTVYSK